MWDFHPSISALVTFTSSQLLWSQDHKTKVVGMNSIPTKPPNWTASCLASCLTGIDAFQGGMDPIGPIPRSITTVKISTKFPKKWGTRSLKLLEPHQSQGLNVSLVFGNWMNQLDFRVQDMLISLDQSVASMRWDFFCSCPKAPFTAPTSFH
jgi:hypothetical protein